MSIHINRVSVSLTTKAYHTAHIYLLPPIHVECRVRVAILEVAFHIFNACLGVMFVFLYITHSVTLYIVMGR